MTPAMELSPGSSPCSCLPRFPRETGDRTAVASGLCSWNQTAAVWRKPRCSGLLLIRLPSAPARELYPGLWTHDNRSVECQATRCHGKPDSLPTRRNRCQILFPFPPWQGDTFPSPLGRPRPSTQSLAGGAGKAAWIPGSPQTRFFSGAVSTGGPWKRRGDWGRTHPLLPHCAGYSEY